MRLPRVFARSGVLCMAAAVALPLATTACGPAPYTGPKTISGTLRGADGSYVDAMLGFDILDAAGRKIQANGAPVTNGGYGALVRLNYCLSSAGSKTATPGCDANPLTDQWSLQLPSNAVTVYVEAYPKKPSNSSFLNNYNGYTGPNPGSTDESTFGMTYRRHVAVLGAGASGVPLVAPKVCGQPGASTGTLWGYITRGGVPWKPASGVTDAWSTEADNAPILGMNEGSVDPGVGTYHITNLQGGSHYTIVATIGGITKQWLTGVQPKVGAACSSTRFDLNF